MALGTSGSLELTAIFTWEEDAVVALCPELDISTFGDTLEEAQEMLEDALQAFFTTADPAEVERRMNSEPLVMPLRITGLPSATLSCCTPRSSKSLAVAIG
jgi:predicted RNase H-like HicB family nuclease